MRFSSKMVTLALGQNGVQAGTRSVLAWCYRGLCYHKHVLLPDRWSVSHVATGHRVDVVEGGFPDEAACERYIAHALTFDIRWDSALVGMTSPDGPIEGTSLHTFNLAVLDWDPDHVPEDDLEENPILDLFGGGG